MSTQPGFDVGALAPGAVERSGARAALRPVGDFQQAPDLSWRARDDQAAKPGIGTVRRPDEPYRAR